MTGAVQAMVRNSRKFAITLSGTLASATSSSPSITTNTITGTPVNGSGLISYAWTQVSGPTDVYAVSPTSASSAFRIDAALAGTLYLAHFKLVGTDGLGRVVDSQDVQVKIKRTGISV